MQRLTIAARARQVARRIAVSAMAHRPRAESGRPHLRLLYCHYVFDDQRFAFERIIRALMARGTFVDTAACLEMLCGRVPIDDRCFHLSFDDGFRNVYTNAVPILERLGVPAEIFVPTDFIDASYEETHDYCVNVINQPGAIEMMTWQDVRQVASLGFGISSHTRSHARLSAISHSERLLQEEIAGSKADIEGRLGGPCKYISWTFGGQSDIDERSLRVVQAAGYEACFGAFRSQVVPGTTDRFRIPRHHFEPEWPLSHVSFFAAGGMEWAST